MYIDRDATRAAPLRPGHLDDFPRVQRALTGLPSASAAPPVAPLAGIPAQWAHLTAAPQERLATQSRTNERPVEADWLATRETALVAVRADFEAALARARTSAGRGPGWTAAVLITDENGQARNITGAPLVHVVDPDAQPVFIGWDEGSPVYRQPAGQWLEFNEKVFAAHYRAQGGAPLQALAAVYGTDAASLLARHPEIWRIATTEHALNAGPAPSGFAMGDAGLLGMVDLYLADPQIAALTTTFGGTPAAAAGAVALEQVHLYGEQRYAQLSRLDNAMQSVREQYVRALVQAQRSGGPGWVERPRTLTLSDESGAQSTQILYVTDENGQRILDARGQPQAITERVFDPDVFAAWYLRQRGLQHEAFAAFYGASHTQFDTDESGRSVAGTIGFDNPNWALQGWAMTHRELVRLALNDPPTLRDASAVGFDLEAGWATHRGNLRQRTDWFEAVVKTAIVAAVAYVSGPTAAKALGLTTTTASGATVLTTSGMAVSSTVSGAASSLTSGLLNGNPSWKAVLQGALAGGLTTGLLGRLKDTVNSAAGALALRATVQGGVQALLGGRFADGAAAGFAGALAELAGTYLQEDIARAVADGSMDAGQAASGRLFARALGSAIRAAGSPDDPGHAFASAFLDDVIQQMGEPVTQASASANEAAAPPAADAPSRSSATPEIMPLLTDPFAMGSDDASQPSYGDMLADELGIDRSDIRNAGWRDEVRRYWNVLYGFAEGVGFSLLNTGEAVVQIANDPGALIHGLKALVASPAARAQFGDEIVRGFKADVQMLEGAWAEGDLRGTGQQLGKLTSDLAQVAGGVEALGRLGVTTATAAGRVLLGAAEDLALANALRTGALFAADGRPLMDFRSLTNAQKGVIGEAMGADLINRIAPGAQRIGRAPGLGQAGIDDLYKVSRPDVDYVIVEYKFGSSKLGRTADGIQMSNDWLHGTATGDNRLLRATGSNPALADDIAVAMSRGRLEKWLVHTDPFGNVSVGLLDKNAKFIPKPISRVIGEKP